MYQAAFAALAVDCSYQLIDVIPGDVVAALRRFALGGGRGANITMPHKVEAMRAASSLGDTARAIGAINVLRLDDWAADNTDAPGIDRALCAAAGRAGVTELLDAGGGAVVFGAGGAARAAAFALARRGLAVTVVGRDSGRARQVLKSLPGGGHGCAQWLDSQAKRAVGRAAVLVNATLVGMGELQGLLPIEADWRVPAGSLVCDLVYRPGETGFICWARRRGAVVVPGVDVLLWQGVLAMEFWGFPPPVEAMRTAVLGAGVAATGEG
jgi:shikimate dehydrogenase